MGKYLIDNIPLTHKLIYTDGSYKAQVKNKNQKGNKVKESLNWACKQSLLEATTSNCVHAFLNEDATSEQLLNLCFNPFHTEVTVDGDKLYRSVIESFVSVLEELKDDERRELKRSVAINAAIAGGVTGITKGVKGVKDVVGQNFYSPDGKLTSTQAAKYFRINPKWRKKVIKDFLIQGGVKPLAWGTGMAAAAAGISALTFFVYKEMKKEGNSEQAAANKVAAISKKLGFLKQASNWVKRARGS